MKIIAATLLLAMAVPLTVSAEDSLWHVASKRANVNVKVLYGIAMTESGMTWSDGTHRPWPWTLNSKYGPMRFKNRAQAANMLYSILRSGVKNVDVGMMQVNCGYHCWRVNDPAELLDPETNLMVAADILREVKEAKDGDTAEAVGAYHAGLSSKRIARANWYQDQVAYYIRKLTGVDSDS